MNRPTDEIILEHISRTIGSDLYVHVEDLKSNVNKAYNNGMTDMCSMILRMIVKNQCNAENIKGWCETYLSVTSDKMPIIEKGENPWQE